MDFFCELKRVKDFRVRFLIEIENLEYFIYYDELWLFCDYSKEITNQIEDND